MLLGAANGLSLTRGLLLGGGIVLLLAITTLNRRRPRACDRAQAPCPHLASASGHLISSDLITAAVPQVLRARPPQE